ncbi:MAG: hypothetical protein QXP81_06510 [Nitrososphaerota archaeon]
MNVLDPHDAVLVKVRLPDGRAQLVGKNLRPYALTAFRGRYDEIGLDWDRLLKVYLSCVTTEDVIDRLIKRIRKYRSVKVVEITRDGPYGWKYPAEEQNELRQLFASLTP